MALPIRDGNQSLTTLSTILVSNSHIPAHTVISFGTQGITDIATAVSGVELGPNTLNALENITVTLGQVTITGGLTDAQLRASSVTIGGSVTATISGTASVTFGTAVITGSASILNFPSTQTVTFGQAPVTFGTAVITGSTSVLNFPATQTVTFSEASVTFGTAVVTGSTSILNFPATQTVTFTQASVTFSEASVTFGTAVITGSTSILNFPATQAVTFGEAPVTFGTVVVTGSASVLNFPATQTVTFTQASVTFGTAVITGSTSIIGTPSVTFTEASVTFGLISGTVTIGSLPAISGTVTANLTQGLIDETGDVGSNYPRLVAGIYDDQGLQFGGGRPFPISGSVTVGTALPAGTNRIGVVTIGGGTVTIGAGTAQIGSVTASNLGAVLDQYEASAQEKSFAVVASINGQGYVSDSAKSHITNSVTIGSLPAISGTVTANNFSQDIYDAANDWRLTRSAIHVSTGGGEEWKQVGGETGAENPLPISGTVTMGTVTANTRSNGISNDPWVYIPRLTMSHPDTGNFVFDGYYRFNGENQWGSPIFNSGNCAYLTRFVQGDNYFFNLMVHDENNEQEITFAQWDAGQTADFPTSMIALSGTLVSGSLTFNTEQRESYGVRVTNSVTANTFAVQGTAVTTSNFTSTTPSTVLASFNATREVLTIFNEGAGNLHISAGATCTTIAYQVRLSAGDYYEVPNHQTSITHSAVFATAGTARVTQVS